LAEKFRTRVYIQVITFSIKEMDPACPYYSCITFLPFAVITFLNILIVVAYHTVWAGVQCTSSYKQTRLSRKRLSYLIIPRAKQCSLESASNFRNLVTPLRTRPHRGIRYNTDIHCRVLRCVLFTLECTCCNTGLLGRRAMSCSVVIVS